MLWIYAVHDDDAPCSAGLVCAPSAAEARALLGLPKAAVHPLPTRPATDPPRARPSLSLA